MSLVSPQLKLDLAALAAKHSHTQEVLETREGRESIIYRV